MAALPKRGEVVAIMALMPSHPARPSGERRPSATENIVDALRSMVLQGRTNPGERLDEQSLGARLQVSRNTLREAFRILGHEHIVEHIPNRGVFVRRLTVDEAHEVYQTRRLLECGALREAAVLHCEATLPGSRRRGDFEYWWQERLSTLRAALQAGFVALDRGDFEAMGTANGELHLALASLAHNNVLDRTLRTLLTEMRLLFVVVADPREVHEPYLQRNAHLHDLVAAGSISRAAIYLEGYLLDAETSLVEMYARHEARSGGRQPGVAVKSGAAR